MEYQVIQINPSILMGMKDILSRSAGYSVSMDDEVEYFNKQNPKTWFAAKEHNQVVGFIRPFSHGDDWTNVEFYIDAKHQDRKTLAKSLLSEFTKNASFSLGHRVRIDLFHNDLPLNQAVQEEEFSQRRQLFHFFEKDIQENRNTPFAPPPITENIEQIVEVLCGLHPVSPEEVKKWLLNKTLRALTIENNVVCAAQVYVHDGSAEINRLATHPNQLRKGYARKLFQQLFLEFSNTGVKKCFLKVENIREPAIFLYQSVGFSEAKEKTEAWHSRWF
jgi:ribosomal protein S18 acetylase RimI-like enzyme